MRRPTRFPCEFTGNDNQCIYCGQELDTELSSDYSDYSDDASTDDEEEEDLSQTIQDFKEKQKDRDLQNGDRPRSSASIPIPGGGEKIA